MVKRELIYTGPGVYCPIIRQNIVTWYRDLFGDPFVGVQVNSIANARTFAQVRTLEDSMLAEFRRMFAAQAGQE